ncbi:MAG: alpha-amylase/4-alpha-glucanotransferase domain-containing protein [Gemmatimonadota bacterium]
MSGSPLDFYCAFHLHQPVGNFGEVFESHIRDVYRPLVAHLAARPEWPVILHVSGPLFEWCEQHDRRFIDDLARLSAAGRTEFLLSGFYEPVLAALSRDDRLQQVAWMREYLADRFGAKDTGLWLTERVWEPDLARDLADAGVQYALVDDRHLLVSGHTRDAMQQRFRTEHDGRHLDILPIDERLRYLIPFQPVPVIIAHMRAERAAGRRLAVFADDGEKFGGWPKTLDWVYGSGWMNEFLDGMVRLQDEGALRLVRGSKVISDAPSGGLTYIATASYHEMEEWSLPPELGVRHMALVKDIGSTRMASEDNAFIRGAHWKHFLVKYPEANRAHKHASALSRLCHARGNPEPARRAIGRAQCNDSLWHGVFGGLYLPWLREAMWGNLAEAEGLLRQGERLDVERIDIDGDGENEYWIHGEHVSVTVAPHRGGAVETYLLPKARENAADALTRRIEAYHHAAVAAHKQSPVVTNSTVDAHGTSGSKSSDGAPSIHEIEQENTLAQLPPADLDVRALLQVRVVHRSLTETAWRDATYVPLVNFARAHLVGSAAGTPAEASAGAGDAGVTIRMRTMPADTTHAGFTMALTVSADGALQYDIDWSAVPGLPSDALVALEASLGARTRATVACTEATTRWASPIESIAKSERGLERTVQGQAVVMLVPASTGRAGVRFTPPTL